MSKVKIQRRPLDAVLLLDKPQGLTSNGALRRVQYLLRAQKGGHGGALDPLATGVLPLCFGQASKFSRYWLAADKSYQVRAQLGVTTDSLDADGQVLQCRPVPILDAAWVQSLLARELTGSLWQIPPIFSALKHEGRPLYELARAGASTELAELKARFVTVYGAELVAMGEDWLDLEFSVSKGTYIRSLVRDLGELLGCGAHVSRLRRLAHGPFRLDDAQAMPSDNQDLADDELLAALKPVHFGLALPRLELDWRQATDLLQGRLLPEFAGQGSDVAHGQGTDQAAEQGEHHGLVQCFAEQRFLGVAQHTQAGLKPARLMSPDVLA